MKKETLEIDAKKAIEALKKTQTEATTTTKTMRDLRNEFKAVKDSMVNMEEGSDEFLAAANKAGVLKHQIDEIGQSANGASSDFGDMVGNVAKLGAGLVGAFQSAQAALSLFGVESEEVVESIKTMQNLMAMTQGLSSIDNGIKAINKLRNSITSTTIAAKALKAVLQPKVIIALTLAITAAVIVWKKLHTEVKETYNAMKEVNEEAQNNVSYAAQQITKIKLLKAEINDENNTLEDKKKALKELNRIIPTYNGYIDDTTGKLIENTKAEEEYVKSLLKEAKARASINLTQKEMEKKLKLQMQLDEKRNELEELNRKLAEDTYTLKSATNNTSQQIFSDAVSNDKRLINSVENDIERLNQDIDEIDGRIVSITNAASDLSTVNDVLNGGSKPTDSGGSNEENKAKEEIAERQKEIDAYIKKLEELAIAADAADIYNKLVNPKDKPTIGGPINKTQDGLERPEEEDDTSYADKIFNRVKLNAEAYAQMENDTRAALEQISKDIETAHNLNLISDEEYATARKNIDDEIAENQKKNAAASVSNVMSMATGISSILSSIASAEDKQSEDSLRRYKAMQTAAATINMLVGITAAISGLFTTKSGPWDIALAAIQAASIAASGLANIHQIQTTELGGSPLTGVANTAGAALATTIIPPQLYSATVQNAQVESKISEQRVYVVESDIKDTTNRVDVQESENRY